MLRPRTNSVVSIIDELLRQSNSRSLTPPMASPVMRPPTGLQREMGQKEVVFSQPRATDMNVMSGSNIYQASTTPQMQSLMQGQIPAASAVQPSRETTRRVRTPRVAPANLTPEDMLANMRRPASGFDEDMQYFVRDAEDANQVRLQDAGRKATQAAILEAKTPELKTDPTFQERISGFFGNRENMLRMAMAFNTMRLEPDQGLTAMLSNELKDLRTQNRAVNVATRLRGLGTPEAIRAAEYIESTGDVKGGMNMYNKAGSVVQKTGAELGGEAAGYDPKKIYNVDTISGKVSGIGGGDTTVTVEGAKKDLFERYYKYVADNRDAFIEAGKAANTRLGAYGRMNRALDFTATGKEESNRQAIRTMLDGLGLSGLIDEKAYANAAAFNAAANQLVAEELRANKGPQTDFDAQFAQTYIPNLSNPKDANREILKYGQSTAQIQRILGQLANRVDANSETVLQDMAEVNEFALTVPNVVIKADGTVMHFYDYYSNNRNADIKDLMKAWILFADRERERQANQ